jgi:hypothetical protein
VAEKAKTAPKATPKPAPKAAAKAAPKAAAKVEPKAAAKPAPKAATKEQKVGLKGIVDDLKTEEKIYTENEKMSESTKKTDQVKKEVFTDLEEMLSLMKGAVEGVTLNVEKVHKKLVSLPADYLGQITPLGNVAKDVQDIQEKTLGHAYNLIKVINSTFNDITKDVITKTNKNML